MKLRILVRVILHIPIKNPEGKLSYASGVAFKTERDAEEHAKNYHKVVHINRRSPESMPRPKNVVEGSNIPFEGPYSSTQKTVTDKSGAKHTPMSRARHLARMAMQKKAQRKKMATEAKDDFEPHMMYDPKTGKSYKAEKPADHVRMAKMGYTHEKPEVKEDIVRRADQKVSKVHTPDGKVVMRKQKPEIKVEAMDAYAAAISKSVQFQRGELAVEEVDTVIPEQVHEEVLVEEAADLNDTNVAKAIKHDCASHVYHEEFGEGTCVPGMHTLVQVDEDTGYVTHYDVMFDHGIEEDVPVAEMKVLKAMSHGHKAKKESKKLDPVGQADADIDNDDDVDSSDRYLHNRRKAIAKAMKK